MSIRDLGRNIKSLLNYDYVDIEDKKSHKLRGVFVSYKYADEIKEYLDKKIAKAKQEKVNDIMQFSGILDGKTDNQTIQELKEKKKEKYL